MEEDEEDQTKNPAEEKSDQRKPDPVFSVEESKTTVSLQDLSNALQRDRLEQKFGLNQQAKAPVVQVPLENLNDKPKSATAAKSDRKSERSLNIVEEVKSESSETHRHSRISSSKIHIDDSFRVEDIPPIIKPMKKASSDIQSPSKTLELPV